MPRTELERFLLVTGSLNWHANAFLAWLGKEEGGHVITAGHAVQQQSTVTQMTSGVSAEIAFRNPAVFGKDLAISRKYSPEKGLLLAADLEIDERLYITGYHQKRRYTIPVRVTAQRNGKLILLPDTPGMAKKGMSGSAVVNENREVVAVLVAQGKNDELVAEFLLDVR